MTVLLVLRVLLVVTVAPRLPEVARGPASVQPWSAEVEGLDERIKEAMAPFRGALALLDTIPGINRAAGIRVVESLDGSAYFTRRDPERAPAGPSTS
ncbi:MULTISPECIES: hypothetical protein [Streptomyces]|uniref:hypothetical protein n=1 Tax=Streptomyces TaxID=1883 RepID=UPI001B343BFD|nr:hypothetical protein [Streptomyces sp. AgN23]QTI90332.1 hypothetical protein AS97_59205 [Streptomyces sp. AgN23]WTA86462.1 hypothetical protein OG751_45160 [Streptomyces antimycoticus]